MSKHTPGPWHLNKNPLSLRDQKNRSIACVLNTTIKAKGLDESLANARLIAAAPEMLSALKDAHLQLTGTTFNMAINEGDFPLVVKIIRTAIAKAEGKE